MRKSSLLWVGLLLVLITIPTLAAGETIVSKTLLPYEILNVSMTQSTMTVTGWAILNETQHFINAADHSYELEFASPEHTFRVNGTITSTTLTDTFRYGGAPICATTAYFKTDTTCYYRFENAGFSFSVPIDGLEIGRNYTVYLVVHAKNANFHKKIPVYYPILNDLVMMNGQKEYRVVSKLNDTKFTVKYATVAARKGPDRSYVAWSYGANCSTTYGNDHFFLLNSVYSNIKERYLNNTNKMTYYRVSTALASCVDSRRRVVEGESFSPVWIASSFVEYSGTPMLVSTRILNTAPVINVENIVLNVGETFRWEDHVTAYDAEEGNLTHKLIVISDNYHNMPGNYQMSFEVSDQYGAKTSATLMITVLEPENNLPMIHADDFSVLMRSTVDLRKFASAYDLEDGDLSELITVDTQADLNVVGVYPVEFRVVDSRGAIAIRSVRMTVFDYDTLIVKFRFVDKDKLFYLEDIPVPWIGYTQRLSLLLETTQVLETITMDP